MLTKSLVSQRSRDRQAPACRSTWELGPKGYVLAILLAAALTFGGTLLTTEPALATSPLTWASPVHADDQPPFAYPTAITGVSCPSTGLCVAVDPAGDVLTSTDPTGGTAAWTRAASVANTLADVSCPSTELCVAIGGGSIATSTDPTGGVGAWTVTNVLPVGSEYGMGTQLEAVSCPSASLCVVTETGGGILTSTEPTGGASAWTTTTGVGLSSVSCPSTQMCVGTSGENVVTSTNPTGGAGAWTVTNVDGAKTLLDVSCSSESLCVATDNYGDVLATTEPTGGAGAWTVTNVDGRGNINHVLCASWGLCIALDDNEVENEAITSMDPTGGASAWTSRGISLPNKYGSQESIEGVSCPAAGLCVLVTGGSAVVSTTEPTRAASAWTVTKLEVGSNALQGVSCVSENLCVAIDDAGNVVTSTDPTAKPGTWTSAQVDGSGGLDGVSCPSARLCVAVDEAGDIVASTEPAGGSSAWHLADIDGSIPLRGVSCPTVSLCVAIDREGDIETSTDPTGGVGAWSFVRLYPGLKGVSCPSEHLCVLTTHEGYIITSTEPAAGANTWSLKHVEANEQISCPSVSLCVTVNSGLVPLVTVGDPLSGASQWAVADVKGLNGLDVVSCAPGGLCVATSESGGNGSPGNVAVSPEPVGGAPAWIESNVYGAPLVPPNPALSLGSVEMPGVSCVPEGMCVVVDTHGRVMVGTPPPVGTPPVTSSPPVVPQGLSGSSGGSDNPSTLTGTVSNAFVLSGMESVTRRGTVRLTLTLPGPGTLQIVGKVSAAQIAGVSRTKKKHKTTLVIARLRLTVSKAGRISATLVPTASAKAVLARRGKLRATITITYTPEGGTPRSIVRTVTFRLKRLR